MKTWEDTVMSDEAVKSELEKHCYPAPRYWDEIDITRKAQAKIAFRAGYEQASRATAISMEYFINIGRKELPDICKCGELICNDKEKEEHKCK